MSRSVGVHTWEVCRATIQRYQGILQERASGDLNEIQQGQMPGPVPGRAFCSNRGWDWWDEEQLCRKADGQWAERETAEHPGHREDHQLSGAWPVELGSDYPPLLSTGYTASGVLGPVVSPRQIQTNWSKCREGLPGQPRAGALCAEMLRERVLFSLEKKWFRGPCNRLPFPSGMLLRRQSQALHSSAWWGDEKEQA